MKNKVFILLSVLLFTMLVAAPAQTTKKVVKDEKKESKLTLTERIQIMTKELQLTSEEQILVKQILTTTQQEKDKIKSQNLKKKDEKEKIEKIKDLQKVKLKKVLGAKRFNKYLQLKKDDVLVLEEYKKITEV